MSAARHEFVRRYATSPIHVARLERLLSTYGPDGAEEAFAATFIEWDHASGDSEAARIVSEVLSTLHGRDGRLLRLTSDAVRGAIKWVAAVDPDGRAARAEALRGILAELAQP